MLDDTFKKQLNDLVTQFLQEGGHTQTVVWRLSRLIDELKPLCREEHFTDEEES